MCYGIIIKNEKIDTLLTTIKKNFQKEFFFVFFLILSYVIIKLEGWCVNEKFKIDCT